MATRAASLVLGLATAFAAATGHARADTAAGAAFYGEGRLVDGSTAEARLGAAGAPVPASVVPCANCHGHDGRGIPERGVDPPTVTWRALTAPYGRSSPSGGVAPPYDAAALGRAVREGVAADGRRLDPAMPRYELDAPTLEALVAHLKTLDRPATRGVAEAVVRIGTLATPDAVGRALLDALAGSVRRVNAGGGIHGRSLELVAGWTGGAPEEIAVAFEGLVGEARPFALVAPMLGDAGGRVERLAREAGVPVIAPLAGLRDEAAAPGGLVFHLDGGVAGQARALLAHTGGGRIVSGCSERMDRLAGTLRRDRAGTGDGGEHRATLVLAGPACQARLVAEAVAGGRALVPADTLSPDVLRLPRRVLERVSVASPHLPGRSPGRAARVFAAIDLDPALAEGHGAVQRHAFSAVELLAEALGRAGRRLSVEDLVDALEGFEEVAAGFAPLQSFSPNRRDGSAGFYVTPLTNGSEAAWVEP